MINSRNKVFGKAALAGLLVSAVALSAASAQEKPRSLVPSFVGGQLDKPLPQEPENQLEAPKAEFETKPANAPTIEINQLGAVHPVSISLLRDGAGALGSDMWQGSDPALVQILYQNLTQPTASPALNSLYKRFLMTGGALIGATADQNDTILDLRMQKMLEAGWTSDVMEFDRRLPSDAKNDSRTLIKLQAMLAAGQTDLACKEFEAQESNGLQKNLGQRTRFEIFCLLKAEDFDRADVKYALMEELGDVDPLFAALYGRAHGAKLDLPEDPISWSPLTTVLYTLGASTVEVLSQDLSGTANLKAAYGAYKDQKADLFPLVSELFVAGAASTSQLVESLPLEQPEYTATDLQKYSQYYSLLAAVKNAAAAEEKAAALLALWNGAASVNDLRMLGVLAMPEFERLPAGDFGADFNLQAVKVALLSGRSDLAKIWERRARRAVFQGAPENRLEARDLVARIDMYMLLSPEQGIAKWTENSLEDWIKASEDRSDLAAAASLLVSQLEVLGVGVGERDWMQLIRLEQPLNAVKSNHSLENAVVIAASNKRKGETVALATMLLNGTSLDEISLTSLRAVTAGLKAVGLENDARGIALEAFIARGI
ncbi:hypothetical protein GUA87_16625 [Sneathiella sp. P13V-1]|uniref:hypothetical protein n=1 Tax=Sneathiella sp. P13V-1 TaxID=2697366 RepID=UPI00187B748C|nr:hypothetical protein [Sneathiella sp. P13V-1]MBE7638484.1 hypothetical protein [Sneathiella sp. P13V-1]